MKSFLITKRFNLILSLFVGTIFIFVLYLYNDLAFQSYRVMFVRLADPGTGYGALFVFYLALLLIISKGNEAEVNKIVTCMYLLILFVFFSGPFQHSIFGWETFNQPYLGEESLIYNPFDESQSRLIMQLYLVIAPLLTCSIFSKQKTIKLSG